jgi:hypothetical protein
MAYYCYLSDIIAIAKLLKYHKRLLYLHSDLMDSLLAASCRVAMCLVRTISLLRARDVLCYLSCEFPGI